MPNGAVFTYREWTRRWGCRAPNPAWRRQPMKTKYFIQPGSYRVRPPAGPIAALVTPRGALPSRSGRTRAKGKGS